jgi:hypothetical protein
MFRKVWKKTAEDGVGNDENGFGWHESGFSRHENGFGFPDSFGRHTKTGPAAEIIWPRLHFISNNW